jgi:hypothetical protein
MFWNNGGPIHLNVRFRGKANFGLRDWCTCVVWSDRVIDS